MDETKNKICYSRKEKLLRTICILGIALCAITGILLFFINIYWGGIIVLLSCVASSFLISNLFTRKVKSWFGDKKKKRLYYTGVYILLLLICMIPTLLVGTYAINDDADVAPLAVEFAENAIKNDQASIEITETEYISFEHNDSFYFELETYYEEYGVGGTVIEKSALTYVKINKFTKRLTKIDFIQFMNAYSYQ